LLRLSLYYSCSSLFSFAATRTPAIYTLSLHDALPIYILAALWPERVDGLVAVSGYLIGSQAAGENPLAPEAELSWWYQFYFATEDRKSTRLNSSHVKISYAGFCLKKKNC